MSPTTKRLTVDQYDQMVENGILAPDQSPRADRGPNRGRRQTEPAGNVQPLRESCRDALAGPFPPGWHVRCGNPVRVPARDSEPEPDVSVVRGQISRLLRPPSRPRRMSPWSSRSLRGTSPKNAGWHATYGGGGIPAYWIVNVAGTPARGLCPPLPSGTQGARPGSVSSPHDPGRARVSRSDHPGARLSARSPWWTCCRK